MADNRPDVGVSTSSVGDDTSQISAITSQPNDVTLQPSDVTSEPINERRQRYMNAAFLAAREALNNQEVPVGCIFVYLDTILSSGRNTVNQTKNATRHAELNCIDAIYDHCKQLQVAPASVFGAVDVYVTVEPCIMCAAALINAGVRSVTYGCANARFGGCGSILDVPNKLMASKVVFEQDKTRIDEAIGLLKEFYKGENPNVPRDGEKHRVTGV